MKWLIGLLVAVPALAGELELERGQSLSVEIGRDTHAVISLTDDSLTISDPVGQDVVYEFPEMLERHARPIGVSGDFDRDGWTELFISQGIGYSGVNVFYDYLDFDPDSGWRKIGEISNPNFVEPLPGRMIGSMKSGPYWIEELWIYFEKGHYGPAVRQTNAAAEILLREELDIDGSVLRRFVARSDNFIDTDTDAVVAKVAAGGAAIIHPEGTERLPEGTRVLAVDYDLERALVQVRRRESDDGSLYWVDPESLTDWF